MTLKEAIQKDGQRHLHVNSTITSGTTQYFNAQVSRDSGRNDDILYRTRPWFLIRFFHRKRNVQLTHEIHFFPSLPKIRKLIAFKHCNL